MDDRCEFCWEYESRQRIGTFRKIHPEYYGEGVILQEITVAMVIRSWKKGTPKRNAGRTTDYRYRGIGYKLNYCPECGRKLT